MLPGGVMSERCLPGATAENNVEGYASVEDLGPYRRVIKSLTWLTLQRRGVAAAEDHRRAPPASLPKQGSWFALTAPVGIFQRKHRGRWRWA